MSMTFSVFAANFCQIDDVEVSNCDDKLYNIFFPTKPVLENLHV